MVELTALSSSSVRVMATFLNFYVSHGSTRAFQEAAKSIIHIYIYFVDNSLLFSIVKEFSKSVNS